jgi:riboflavin kinase/FMN adenylyltransferase
MGDKSVLLELGLARGFGVTVLPPVQAADGHPVSSTAIRRAVAGGDLNRAAEGLGRPYAIAGRVISGDKRGRLLGFPTLNVTPPSQRKLLPPDGVYAVRVQTPQGAFGGMANIGPRPTFGDNVRGIEAHVFDASHDWYGAAVRIDLIARLRDVQTFAGVDALREQLGRDEALARLALRG